MDGRSRQNPAYRPANGKPRTRGAFPFKRLLRTAGFYAESRIEMPFQTASTARSGSLSRLSEWLESGFGRLLDRPLQRGV